MSKSSAPSNGTRAESTYFQQQRDLLIRDIGTSMEQVLQNINKLNRSLEGIVAVGTEFSSVEALWSHFESVMAKDAPTVNRDDATKDVEANETVLQDKDNIGR